MSGSETRSPYLFDREIDHRCSAHGCEQPAARVVVQLLGLADDTGEIQLTFLCDDHANAAHAAMELARGVA